MKIFPLQDQKTQLSVTPLMPLCKEKLDVFKKALNMRREAIESDLHQAMTDLIETEEFYSDAVDQAAAIADRSLSVRMANRERNTLSQIKAALRRIAEGSFGECEQCGEWIAEARMKASPFTTLCIECKAELESTVSRLPGRV